MASAQIQMLLRPADTARSQKLALDYVNANFKTVADLEDQSVLESAVHEAQYRREDLHDRLSRSQERVDALIAKTRSSAEQHLYDAQELSLLRHSLADELASLSGGMVSSMSGSNGKPTLLEDLETLHRNLKELENVRSYVQVIEHALKLSESAVQQVKNTPSFTCVSEYEALQRFSRSVTEAFSPVDDVAGQQQQKLQITSFLENVRHQTWLEIKTTISSHLLAAAEKLQWPSPVEYASCQPSDRKAFEVAFSDLLRLQTLGKKLHGSSNLGGLYPIEALVHPVTLRFKYHFEGTRQTNRLDKPEWYFTHILNVSHEHRPFMESVIQGLLLNTEYRDINAWREFTFLLLPLLARKLKRSIPALLAHPPVLAHTIYQALAFDSALKEESFDLAGTSNSNGPESWEGISEVILGRKEWFEAWMQEERKFAMNQYMDIISASDAWLIANDDGNEDDEAAIDRELKPTNSARRVKALVEQVTDRYSPLPHFTQRTRFLITVQLPLLESYHARISASLDAFETLSSSFMRAVPGALGESSGRAGDANRLTSGVEGVQRLCKAFLSAKYIAAAMEAWGEDVFFLELWTEINQKASLRIRAEAVTSLPDPNPNETDPLDGTIFEELVTQYVKLAGRAEELIVHSICHEVEVALRAHFSIGKSTQVSPEIGGNIEDDISLASTLLGPIALLSSHLSFLHSVLPQATVISLYRRIASHLASHILQRAILYRGRARVNPQEGRTILAESELWVETCRVALGRGERARIEGPWRRLLQASRLIGAEGQMWQTLVDVTLGVSGDTEWEETMMQTVGFTELTREETEQVLRVRTDCER